MNAESKLLFVCLSRILTNQLLIMSAVGHLRGQGVLDAASRQDQFEENLSIKQALKDTENLIQTVTKWM